MKVKKIPYNREINVLLHGLLTHPLHDCLERGAQLDEHPCTEECLLLTALHILVLFWVQNFYVGFIPLNCVFGN